MDPAGLEPATTSLWGRDSNHWAIDPYKMLEKLNNYIKIRDLYRFNFEIENPRYKRTNYIEE